MTIPAVSLFPVEGLMSGLEVVPDGGGSAPVHAVEVGGHEDAGSAVRARLAQTLHLARVIDLRNQPGGREGVRRTCQWRRV